MRLHLPSLAVAGLLAAFPAAADTLVYRGHLEAGHAPANGRYDLRLVAHGDAKFGNTLAAPMEFPAVPVVDGAFRIEFDLPPGAAEAWVELSVRAAGESSWSTIPGRTKAVAAPAAIGQCWSSTGDEGSDPATNFLGTIDAQSLVLRTRNAQSLRIDPWTGSGSNRPNIIAGAAANGVTTGVRGATISGGGTASGEEGASSTPNRVTGDFGTVGGGHTNVAAASASVSGGRDNRAEGAQSVVAGGVGNRAQAASSTVGGGFFNVGSGTNATVAGGESNVAGGGSSAVGGGFANTASGVASAVVGGSSNTASAFASAVGGGELNCAGGAYSWAGGRNAGVRPGTAAGALGSGCAITPASGDADGDQGTFVWADAQSGSFVSSGANQFLVRAGGGVLFNTSTVVNPGVDDVTFRAGNGGDADIDLRLVTRTGKNASLFVRDASGGLVVGLPSMVAGDTPRLSVGGPGGNATLSNGGTWTNASSRAFKDGITAIEPLDVLTRLLALPITRWTYTGSTEGTHLGPMAEDFKAAFGLAGDGRSIATVDADGVALAAIQGLNAKLEAENAALLARIEALERAVLGARAAGE